MAMLYDSAKSAFEQEAVQKYRKQDFKTGKDAEPDATKKAAITLEDLKLPDLVLSLFAVLEPRVHGAVYNQVSERWRDEPSPSRRCRTM